ncbi:MAG: ORF6N domain-containing protein [Tannerellaceae bacterium]|nr:ORF6N domain-containing protein [Tannerellaceae bacterium]
MELEHIQSKIYEIRGVRVMLDFDLAVMYGTETKRLKEAVRRNIERFEGDDFMFELTKDEVSRTQIATLNKRRGGNIINEDTRIQLELINQSLAELSVRHKQVEKPRNPVGFVKSK